MLERGPLARVAKHQLQASTRGGTEDSNTLRPGACDPPSGSVDHVPDGAPERDPKADGANGHDLQQTLLTAAFPIDVRLSLSRFAATRQDLVKSQDGTT